MAGLWDIFLSFFRIGAFTLGGGWAMLPLVREEVVTKKRWIAGPAFVDMLALAQASPGAVAVNIAVAVGYRLRRGWGVLAAVLGVVLPSFVIIIVVAIYLVKWQKFSALQRIMAGIRPAVGALIAWAALGLKGNTLQNKADKLVTMAALVALLAGVHPMLVLLAAGLLGIWRRGQNEVRHGVS